MTEETKKAPAKKPAAKKAPAKKVADAKPAAEGKASAKPATAAKVPAKKASKAPAADGQLKVTQIGSPLGRKKDQRLCLMGLGLNKMNRSRVLEDTPSIRGMINKVKHLVKVEAA